MESKKTVVIGASTNPNRYSYMAIHRLIEKGHEVVPVGIKKGDVGGLKIVDYSEEISDVNTITLYLGPQNQPPYYNYILGMKPKRVIFNPGSINPELMDSLRAENVEVVDACTLVMLSTGSY